MADDAATTTPDTGQGAGQQNAGTATDAAKPNGTAAAGTGPDTGKPSGDQNGDATDYKAEAEKWKALARKHEDQAKANLGKAKVTEDQMSAIAKALGLETDKPTLEGLQSTLAEKDSQLQQQKDLVWEIQLERAAEKAAKKAGGDPELVVPVLFHSGALDDLNPDDAGWDDAITKKVGELVKANPRLRAEAAPDLKQGNRGAAGAGDTDPNGWLRDMVRGRR